MKKLIYSLAMILVGMSSCATFDEPTTENYGAGPDVALSVTAGTPTDNAFNIQVTPGEGATYYTMAISTSPAQIDSAVFIKGGYGNTVIKVADLPAINQSITTASPNTTYYVYAVACNDKGVVGKLASASIKTTDAGAPQKAATQVDAASKTAVVAFDQEILRGEGKVTAKYYKEYDFMNPVEIETVDVAISKNVAQMKVDAPEGAYVIYSWEEGAFVDEVGNRCAAFTSTLNMEGESVEEIFANALWLQVPTTTWAITDDQFTAPKVGGTFPKWNEFEGVIEFKNKVYVVESLVKDGDFVVTYSNDSRTVSYKLPKANIKFGVAEDFSTQKVTFTLPAATQPGDKVTVSIAEGVFKDILGNGNAAYASDKVYWIAFSMKKEDVLGNFSYIVTKDGEDTNLGNFSIVENTEAENSLTLKNFYLENSEVPATYSIDDCQVYVKHLAYVGDEVIQGTTYSIFTYDASGNGKVTFDVNADGTLTSSDLFLVATPDMQTLYGYVSPSLTTFAPVKEAASARRAGSKMKGRLGAKLNVKLNKKLSK